MSYIILSGGQRKHASSQGGQCAFWDQFSEPVLEALMTALNTEETKHSATLQEMQGSLYCEIAFMDKTLNLFKTPACHTGGHRSYGPHKTRQQIINQSFRPTQIQWLPLQWQPTNQRPSCTVLLPTRDSFGTHHSLYPCTFQDCQVHPSPSLRLRCLLPGAEVRLLMGKTQTQPWQTSS